jgi:hypothetical protein
MKRYLLCMIVLLALKTVTFSQAVATEGKYEYQRGEKPAAIIELPYKSDLVEGALKQKLAKNGVKEEKLKGMQVFKGTRLTPTDGEAVDMYFKVDRKSRRDDNNSVVYLILGRPNENVALRTPEDAYRIQEARDFLNKIIPDIEAYKLELDIASQEDVIKKSEKNLKNLVDDQKSIENKIRDLQDKLSQNKLDQDATNAQLIKQRTDRDGMLSRRVLPASGN